MCVRNGLVLWVLIVLSVWVCVVSVRLDVNPKSGEDFRESENSRSGHSHLYMQRPRPIYKSPHDVSHPVRYAAVPQGLHVVPLPLKDSDHELVFNVSWRQQAGFGYPAKDYSLVASSITKTKDCDTPICYECCIPGDVSWSIVPSISHPVAETCAIKPGCTYQVTLTAHPWDGHTSANMIVELDECVAGVCSCAHAAYLPAPSVSAHTISINGDLFVNVTWTLAPSHRPVRLPRGLMKQYYFINLGKQMVSDAHPSPWFARSPSTSRRIEAFGPVTTGDQPKWFLLPISEKKGARQKTIVLDVKLLARVNLIDERGCMGPAGNATAYDPTEDHSKSFSAYALWATLGGACVIAILLVLGVSAGIVKKVARAIRAPPVSAPLEPLRLPLRNAWFPMQIHGKCHSLHPVRGTAKRSMHLSTS